MPYVPVPKDLTAVKTKVALNLTKRQLICFPLALAVGFPIYLLTRNALGTSGAVLVMIAAVLPFFFLAMYEKNGQPCEKIIKQYIRSRFIQPKTRPYKTDNLYSAIIRQNQLDKEVENIVNTKKKRKSAQEKNQNR